ncbi:MAG: homocysteine S-methyltransferase family protein [Candidatus Omnitrophica bacterium]|nr:homocysteine S-methyltransferase family protein [Candidatus Omnitrophota bacterium]
MYNKDVSNLPELLNKKKILVADGAWGTEISKKVPSKDVFPELLNITHPEIIEKIASAYVEAGADIILTNTFGGNFFKLKKYGAEDKIEKINRSGVEISKKAAGNRLVFASVGPTGELLQPYGTLSEKELIDCYRQQVQILINAEADGIVIETMSDVREAVCALIAAKEISKDVVVSITFNHGTKGYKTMMGQGISECAVLLKNNGADVIGSNCGSGIKDFIAIAKEMKKASSLPVWIKPNAGIPQLIAGKTVYPDSPEDMAKYVDELIEAGASVIGGCCGTTPFHIKKIAQVISKYTSRQ